MATEGPSRQSSDPKKDNETEVKQEPLASLGFTVSSSLNSLNVFGTTNEEKSLNQQFPIATEQTSESSDINSNKHELAKESKLCSDQTNKGQASQSFNDQTKELQSNDCESAEQGKQEESQLSHDEQLTKRETSQLLANTVTKDGNQGTGIPISSEFDVIEKEENPDEHILLIKWKNSSLETIRINGLSVAYETLSDVAKDKWKKLYDTSNWLLVQEIKRESDPFCNVSALSMHQEDCFDIKNLIDDIWTEAQNSLDAVILEDNVVLSERLRYYVDQNESLQSSIPCFKLNYKDFANIFALQNQTHGKMECSFVRSDTHREDCNKVLTLEVWKNRYGHIEALVHFINTQCHCLVEDLTSVMFLLHLLLEHKRLQDSHCLQITCFTKLCNSDAFEQDFPIYLILTYVMQTESLKLTQKSDEFIKKCLTKFEKMNTGKIVDGMRKFIRKVKNEKIDGDFPKRKKDIFYCLHLACVYHMKERAAIIFKDSPKIYVEIIMKWGMILYKALETSCHYHNICSDIDAWNLYIIEKDELEICTEVACAIVEGTNYCQELGILKCHLFSRPNIHTLLCGRKSLPSFAQIRGALRHFSSLLEQSDIAEIMTRLRVKCNKKKWESKDIIQGFELLLDIVNISIGAQLSDVLISEIHEYTKLLSRELAENHHINIKLMQNVLDLLPKVMNNPYHENIKQHCHDIIVGWAKNVSMPQFMEMFQSDTFHETLGYKTASMLISHVHPSIILTDLTFKEFVKEIQTRYSTAKSQVDVFRLLQKIGVENCYANQKHQFVIDLLSIPELLVGDTKEDVCVQNDFEEYIESFIREINTSETQVLLLNIIKIRSESIVCTTGHISLILKLLPHVCKIDSTNMKTIAEMFSSKLTRHCSCEKSLVLKSPSAYQKCLWNFVVNIAEEILGKSEITLQFLFTTSEVYEVTKCLLNIYQSANKKHNLLISNFENQEYDAVVLSYIGSIKCVYDAVMTWRQKLLSFEATWNDTVWLKKNHWQFNELSELLRLHDELQPISESTVLLEDIMKGFEDIYLEIEDILTCQNKVFLKDILSHYGVNFPESINIFIEKYLQYSDANAEFPQCPNLIRNESIYDISYNKLSDTVDILYSFLEPVRKFLPFIEYFHCNKSQLFHTFMEQVSADGEQGNMQRLVYIIEYIKRKIDKIMTTDGVNYDDVRIMCNLSQINRQKEMDVLHNFPEYKTSDISSFLAMINDVNTLLLFQPSIESVVTLCNRFELKSCLNDQTFEKVKSIIDVLLSEDRKLQMQLSEASDYLKTIRQVFKSSAVEVFSDEDRKPYLELIAELAKSEKFHLFLKSHRFLSERGLFHNKLQLVTTQLQEDEYGSEVIDQLLPAFTLVSPLDENIEFPALIDHIFQQENPSHYRKQLQMVNSSMEGIHAWFSGIDEDSMEVTKANLTWIEKNGMFCITVKNGVVLNFTKPKGQTEKWCLPKIQDFVQKVAFLKPNLSEQKNHFLECYKTAMKLLTLYQRLWELGHQEYSDEERIHCFKCIPANLNFDKLISDLETQLEDWKQKSESYYKTYKWLLILSNQKLKRIYQSFCSSESSIKSANLIMKELEFILPYTKLKEEQFQQKLKMVIRNVTSLESDSLRREDFMGSLTNDIFSEIDFNFLTPPSEETINTAFAYKCFNFTSLQLLKFLGSLYDGIPSSLQILQCNTSTSEDEVRKFFLRIVSFPGHYTIVEVNKLNARLQEILFNLYVENISKTENSRICVHFIETEATVIEDAYKVISQSVDPDNIFSQSIWKREKINIKLICGLAGNGKTHFIRKQTEATQRVTIPVNESFAVHSTIKKLQKLHERNVCVVHFNFTSVPPGINVDNSETQRYNTLVEKIGWFMFQLLVLGYIEDTRSGESFSFPQKEVTIFVEIPSLIDELSEKDEKDLVQESLTIFWETFPVFNFLGSSHIVLSTEPYRVDDDVKLVCKYLKAYEEGWIDLPFAVTSYGMSIKERSLQEKFCEVIGKSNEDWHNEKVLLKFSLIPDFTDETEYLHLLNKYMNEQIKRKKLTQKLFIGYMKRRCEVLDNSPYFCRNTISNLGSMLIRLMIKEVEEFCSNESKAEWSSQPHQQIIYETQNYGGSFDVITLKPEKIPENELKQLKEIHMNVRTESELKQRKVLDNILARGLELPLLTQQEELDVINKRNYVLTLDFALKMLNIYERFQSEIPVVIVGETGVGKTSLLEVLSELLNTKLNCFWIAQHSRIVKLLNEWHLLKRTSHSSFEDSVSLKEGSISLIKEINDFVVKLKDSFVVTTLKPVKCDVKELWSRMNAFTSLDDKIKKRRSTSIEEADENTPISPTVQHSIMSEEEEKLIELATILTESEVTTFHKLGIHAGLKPNNIRTFIEEIKTQAKHIKEVYLREREKEREKERERERDGELAIHTGIIQDFPQELKVIVYLDEVNTSSCLGFIKELLVDHSMDGEDLPDNLYIVASCNPFRGDGGAVLRSLKGLSYKHTYYVRQMHPSIEFLKWDYGALGEEQERDYIVRKMEMINDLPNESIGTSEQKGTFDLMYLLFESQERMRQYTEKELTRLQVENPALCAKSSVSQRDIQRFFDLYEWIMKTYNSDTRGFSSKEKCQRAVLVSLGLVYYLRLPDEYRKDYSALLDNHCRHLNIIEFSKAFDEELNWYIAKMELGQTIASTKALKENVLAIIACCVTHTPLIIVGEPGTSKTLSFNITLDNLRGKESPNPFFRSNTELFPSLLAFFYQCSKLSTSDDIEKVFTLAIKRQKANRQSGLSANSVVFMDEAGLPEERHESLKVIHYYLDSKSVSFVAITNHALDAAKSNRAICVLRPPASSDDLKTLAKHSAKKAKDDDEDLILTGFCNAFSELMKDEDSSFQSFLGLRDFIHFITYLQRMRGKNKALSDQLVLQGLERNMNGHERFDYICKKFLPKVPLEKLERRDVLTIIKDSLEDRLIIQRNETRTFEQEGARYKIIIDDSEDESAMKLLFSNKVLDEKAVIHLCSDFAEESNLHVDTIAGIKHSAREGQTVVLCQTEEIHESFYELFNQRFRVFDTGENVPHLFANISVGSHTRLCRIDQKFQCIVVIKKSALQSAQVPSPFLNRFEKYFLSFESVYNTVCKQLPKNLKRLLDIVHNKVTKLVEVMQSSDSFYGYSKRLELKCHDDNQTNEFSDSFSKESSIISHDTLHSLLLSLLPIQSFYKQRCVLPQVSYSESPEVDEANSEICPEWKKNNLPYAILSKAIITLRETSVLNIPKIKSDDLQRDANDIFEMLLKNEEFNSVINEFNVEGAVGEALDVLHYQETDEIGYDDVHLDACLVIAAIAQWLIRYVTKRLFQILTPEALLLHKDKLPTSLIKSYLDEAEHFSLQDLVLNHLKKIKSHEHDYQPLHLATKIICYTRSSSITSSTFGDERRALNLQFGEESTYYLKITTMLSEDVIKKKLGSFCNDSPCSIFLATANMHDITIKMINHFRIMIEEKEREFKTIDKLFVLLLHFTPSQFFNPCYPALFIQGWDHFYLDSLSCEASNIESACVDIKQCFRHCLFPKQSSSMMFDFQCLLPQAITFASARVPIATSQYLDDAFNQPMAIYQREEILKKLFDDMKFGCLLCDLFMQYWTPQQTHQFLVDAADFTSSNESSLSIVRYINTRVSGLFSNYILYMIAFMNEDGNLDILASDSSESQVELFTEILKATELPKLSSIHSLCKSLREPKYMGFQFPFFRTVFNEVEMIAETSRETVKQKMNREERARLKESHAMISNQMKDQLKAIGQSDCQRDRILVAVISCLNKYPDLREKYIGDFVKHKLKMRYVETHYSETLEFQKKNKANDSITWLTRLHIEYEIHSDDYGHSCQCIKRLIQDDQEWSSLLSSQTRFTLEYLSGVIIANARSKLVVGFSSAAGLEEWYKAMKDIMTMPKQYEALLDQRHVQSFHSLYTVFIILHFCGRDINHISKIFSELDEVHEMQDIFRKAINLVSKAEIMSVVQQLLRHFFYKPENVTTSDFKWFLKCSNRNEERILGTFLLDCISPSLYRYYIGKWLSYKNKQAPVEVVSFHKEKRSLVGEILEKFKPPSYVELLQLYQDCTSKNIEQMADMYFLICLEYLQSYSTYTAISTLEKREIADYIDSAEHKIDGEHCLQIIENVAVLVTTLRLLGTSLTKQEVKVTKRSVEIFNNFLQELEIRNPGVSEQCGIILLSIIQKGLKYDESFIESMTHSYQIYTEVHCLKPYCESLKELKLVNKFSNRTILCFSAQLTEIYNAISMVLKQIATEDCTESLLTFARKNFSGSISIEFDEDNIVLPELNVFAACVWLCSYFEFFDQKITSEKVAKAVGELTTDDMIPTGVVQLIQCFIDPENRILEKAEVNIKPNNKIMKDVNSGDLQLHEEKEPRSDPIRKFFCNTVCSQLEDKMHGYALANMVAMILLLQQKTHLWYHLFAIEELEGSFMTGYMYDTNVTSEQCYDWGVEFLSDGSFGRPDYEDYAFKGNLSLLSLYFSLWANFGSFCLALLTQENVTGKMKGRIISSSQPIRHYCLEQMKKMWSFLTIHLDLLGDEINTLFLISFRNILKDYNCKSITSGQLLKKEQRLIHERIFDEMFQLSLQETSSKLTTDFEIPDITASSASSGVTTVIVQESGKYQIFWQLKNLRKSCVFLPSEQFCLHYLQQNIKIHSRQNLKMLSLFTFHYQRLKAASKLLPNLIKFYKWLHSDLAYRITKRESQGISLSDAVRKAAKRYPRDIDEKYQKLYTDVEDCYNEYLTVTHNLIGDGTCSDMITKRETLGITQLNDTYRLISYLSWRDRSCGGGLLFVVIKDIIEHQNEFLKKTAYFINDIDLDLQINPSEINELSCIVDEYNMDELIPLFRRHFNRRVFDLETMQKDILDTYLSHKYCFDDDWEQQLFCTFHFKEETLTKNPALDILDVETAKKLPENFKENLPRDHNHYRMLVFQFFSSEYEILLCLTQALINVAEKLYLMLDRQEDSLTGIDTSKISILEVMLKATYGKSSSDYEDMQVFEALKVTRLTESQKDYFRMAEACYLVSIISHLVEWINDGTYDYSTLPRTMKKPMDTVACKAVTNIQHFFKGSSEDLIDRLNMLQDMLVHSELKFQRDINTLAKKPLIDVIKADEDDRLTKLIPRTILVEHYVSFRIELRRLISVVTNDIQKRDKENDDAQKWSDYVEDMWQTEDTFKDIYDNAKPFDYNGLWLPQKNAMYGFPMEYQSDSEFYSQTEDSITSEKRSLKLASLLTSSIASLHGGDKLNKLAHEMTTEDILEYLDFINLKKYRERFKENEIDGDMMKVMDEETLKEDLGISSRLERKKIITKFPGYLESKLKQKAAN